MNDYETRWNDATDCEYPDDLHLNDEVHTSYGSGPYRITKISRYPTCPHRAYIEVEYTDDRRGAFYLSGYSRKPDGRYINYQGDELIIDRRGNHQAPLFDTTEVI